MELKTYVELNLSAFLVFNLNFPGQESDQPDADGKPGQENQGRGGSEASLDLPEREGGLCIPQVRHHHTTTLSHLWTNYFYLSLGKKLWTAWRNSMHEENWKAQYWRQCWSLGTSQVRKESQHNDVNCKDHAGWPETISVLVISGGLSFIYEGFVILTWYELHTFK